MEGVYVKIGNLAFSLFLYLTGVQFRDELQHGGDVSEWKSKYRPIRTREIGGVSLLDVLYVYVHGCKKNVLISHITLKICDLVRRCTFSDHNCCN